MGVDNDRAEECDVDAALEHLGCSCGCFWSSRTQMILYSSTRFLETVKCVGSSDFCNCEVQIGYLAEKSILQKVQLMNCNVQSNDA